jgi:tetratricopeptide (TPR) repeat protein
MRTVVTALALLFGLSVLAGCATTFGNGVAAAREGRYADASRAFERVLAEDPDRFDALVHLGIARYKLDAFDAAISALERAQARAPRDATVQLYLGVSHLQKGEVGPADEHLTAFAGLADDRRIAAQAERALRLLRGVELDAETRAFVAASLDGQAELLREVSEARRALAAADARAWTYATPLCAFWWGRLRCF